MPKTALDYLMARYLDPLPWRRRVWWRVVVEGWLWWWGLWYWFERPLVVD